MRQEQKTENTVPRIDNIKRVIFIRRLGVHTYGKTGFKYLIDSGASKIKTLILK